MESQHALKEDWTGFSRDDARKWRTGTFALPYSQCRHWRKNPLSFKIDPHCASGIKHEIKCEKEDNFSLLAQ